MKTSTTSAVLPCTLDIFWGSFLNESYLRALYLDRATNEWTWQMVQPANLDPKSKPRKDAVTMHGTVRVEPTGEGHCRRTDSFTVEAKIFGLGGLIESSIERELQSARAKEYAFLARWVEQQAPGKGSQ